MPKFFQGAFAALILLPLAANAQPAAQSPLRPVRVQKVHLLGVSQSWTYSGTVQARRLADLSFRVAGKIIARDVDIGTRVHAGQVLERLDPTDLQLQLHAAEAAVAAAAADDASARADLARYVALGRNSPSFLPSEFDHRLAAARAAAARLDQAQRQAALARDQLTYGELTADADGVVTALPAEVGQVVAAGQTVASLAHEREIEISVDVPENRLPTIRAASSIDVALWSAPDHPLAGRLREIGGRADAASRTFAVRISLAEAPPGLLALGMTATVSFRTPPGPPLAVLPATSLVDQDGKPAVWVLDEVAHRAGLRQVTLAGYAAEGTVAIAAGLAEGEQVVTAGTGTLDGHLPVTAWAGPVR